MGNEFDREIRDKEFGFRDVKLTKKVLSTDKC